MSDFLTALETRVLVLDGAFGTWVQAQDLTADDFGGEQLEGCNENLVLTRPDLVAQMHREYFEAGVDAVETATFGAFGLVLAEYGISEVTFDLNVAAARIAKEVAAEFATPDRPRFVVGSIGPGTRLPSLGAIKFAELRDDYQVQAAGLLEGGADVLLIETVYDLLQAKSAIVACRRAMRDAGRTVPLMVQVTMETTGRMLVGSEIGAAVTALEAMKPDVLGLNCATGPAEMTEHLRYLKEHARTFLSCLPNAGLPSVVDGHTHYDLTPDGLADAHERFVTEFGINIVGGCCGTTPGAPCVRSWTGSAPTRCPTARVPDFEPGCSSIYSHVPYHQELAYLAVGERTNANGSRKFRDAMLEGDWDTCVQMARDQVKEGAHVLDVCVDYVGRDGTIDMEEIASRFATQAALPLVFDSTEPWVVEAGLQHSGGKAMLNSANLEDGEAEGSRMDRMMTLASEYGAAVICLAIDEEGQARDADWKLRVCKRIYDIAIERYGIDPTDLIFDMLTFPLGSGQEDLRKDAHGDHRGDPAGQGRAARLVDHPRALERELRPEPGDPPRAEQRVPARVPRGRARRGDRARGAHHADAQDRREGPRARARSHLRPPPRRLRPAHRADGPLRRRRGRHGRARRPLGLAGRGPPEAAHHRRRAGRSHRRARRSAREWSQGAVDHQRRPARGHEGGRRPVRPGRDAAPVRVAERRDDEGRRRVPRAAHGEGRRGRQGCLRHRHGQG